MRPHLPLSLTDGLGDTIRDRSYSWRGYFELDNGFSYRPNSWERTIRNTSQVSSGCLPLSSCLHTTQCTCVVVVWFLFLTFSSLPGLVSSRVFLSIASQLIIMKTCKEWFGVLLLLFVLVVW